VLGLFSHFLPSAWLAGFKPFAVLGQYLHIGAWLVAFKEHKLDVGLTSQVSQVPG